MAISFVAAGTVIQGPNPTIPVPTGYAAGDLLILVLNNSAPPASITGWTLLTSNIAVPQFSIFYKTAGASESSVAITSASATSVNVMLAYRGTSGFDVTGAFANTGSATSLATATLTTTQANDYIISIYGSGSLIASGTWTAPASTTSRVNSSTVSGKRGLLIVDELQASAGATTARTATLSLANQITSIGLSIKEPAAATVNSNFFLLML
jgi:hypothetical protein